jgi:hypothetical protein
MQSTSSATLAKNVCVTSSLNPFRTGRRIHDDTITTSFTGGINFLAAHVEASKRLLLVVQ